MTAPFKGTDYAELGRPYGNRLGYGNRFDYGIGPPVRIYGRSSNYLPSDRPVYVPFGYSEY